MLPEKAIGSKKEVKDCTLITEIVAKLASRRKGKASDKRRERECERERVREKMQRREQRVRERKCRDGDREWMSSTQTSSDCLTIFTHLVYLFI